MNTTNISNFTPYYIYILSIYVYTCEPNANQKLYQGTLLETLLVFPSNRKQPKVPAMQQ